MENEDSSPQQSMAMILSKCQAEKVLSKMSNLGYFHDNASPICLEQGEELDDDDILQTVSRSLNTSQKRQIQTDVSCGPENSLIVTNLVEDSSPYFYTRDRLMNVLYESLMESHGRLSLEQIAKDVNVTVDDINDIALQLSTEYEGSISLLERTLITADYFDELCRKKVIPEVEFSGRQLVSDLALHLFKLPLGFTIIEVEKCFKRGIFNEDVKIVVGDDGAKQLVTIAFERRREQNILKLFQDVKEPANVDETLNEKLDISTTPKVLKLLKESCDSGILKGELHAESFNSIGAIFIPHSHVVKQKEAITSFFAENGFITAEYASKHGMSMMRLEHCITTLFPSAICLDDMILYPEMVLAPIQATIEECLSTNSFVELSMHIPQDLLRKKECIRRIIEDFVLAGLTSKTEKGMLGYLVVNREEVFFFSNQMAKDIEEKTLRPMIKVYAMERALEEERAVHFVDNHDEGSLRQSDRITRKHSKRAKKTGDEGDKRFCTDRDIVPLNAVVVEITKRYPGLSDIQESKYGEITGASWDDDVGEKGTISQFCRIALYTEMFREMCSNAVKVELEKIVRKKNGVSCSREQSATTFKSIEASFEDKDCFAASCYLLQMLSRFSLSTVSMNNESNSDALIMNEFLLICANFARRVTQFALYKHGVDENTFSFSDGAGDSEFFFSQVDLSTRSFKSVYLSCIDDNEGQPQDSISLLRESLPGNVGVVMAHMWALTGESHYSGVSNNSSGEGDAEKFLLHVKENCLSMCGIPFKILDKKIEKQLMLRRKKELRQQLEAAVEQKDVIELSIMLLYQQVRGLVVTGSELSRLVFKYLLAEKRFPSDIANRLRPIFDQLQCLHTIREEDLDFIRKCGLCKDLKRVLAS